MCKKGLKSRDSEELPRFGQMIGIPFLDCLTTVLTTGNMRVVTTELLFCANIWHFKKSIVVESEMESEK